MGELCGQVQYQLRPLLMERLVNRRIGGGKYPDLGMEKEEDGK